MENTMNTITTSINANSLWGQVGSIIPFIVPLILFGFGLGLIIYNLKFRRRDF